MQGGGEGGEEGGEEGGKVHVRTKGLYTWG